MENSKCKDHPQEDLRFVCLPCGEKLVCRDCKLADHEGHKTKDISKVAEASKELFIDYDSKLDMRIASVESLQVEARTKRKEFEKSLQRAKREVNARAERVAQFAKSKLKEINSEGKRHHDDVDTMLQEKLEILRNQKQMARSVLDNTVTGHRVVEIKQYFKQHGPGHNPTIDNVERDFPKHDLKVAIQEDKTLEDEKATERLIGYPRLVQASNSRFVQTNTNFPCFLVLPQFRCSEDSECYVKEIYPMEDGRVGVAYSTEVDGNTNIAMFTSHGEKQQERVLTETGQVSMAHHASDILHVVHHTTEKRMMMDLNLQPPDSPKGKGQSKGGVFFLQKLAPGKYSICQYMTGPKPKTLFSVLVDKPVAVSANSSGHYFAVRKENGEVVVFQRSNGTRVGTFEPDLFQIEPTRVCFHHVGGQEVLLVADETSDSIYIVDFIDDCRLIGPLISGCPMVVSPTAVTSNGSGPIWVGCKGGQILTLDEESLYEEPSMPGDITPIDFNESGLYSGTSSSLTEASDNDVRHLTSSSNQSSAGSGKEETKSHPQEQEKGRQRDKLENEYGYVRLETAQRARCPSPCASDNRPKLPARPSQRERVVPQSCTNVLYAQDIQHMSFDTAPTNFQSAKDVEAVLPDQSPAGSAQETTDGKILSETNFEVRSVSESAATDLYSPTQADILTFGRAVHSTSPQTPRRQVPPTPLPRMSLRAGDKQLQVDNSYTGRVFPPAENSFDASPPQTSVYTLEDPVQRSCIPKAAAIHEAFEASVDLQEQPLYSRSNPRLMRTSNTEGFGSGHQYPRSTKPRNSLYSLPSRSLFSNQGTPTHRQQSLSHSYSSYAHARGGNESSPLHQPTPLRSSSMSTVERGQRTSIQADEKSSYVVHERSRDDDDQSRERSPPEGSDARHSQWRRSIPIPTESDDVALLIA
ncbi:hypothetical protein BaRGS_00017042, partial [Batillaria attramentaria]